MAGNTQQWRLLEVWRCIKSMLDSELLLSVLAFRVRFEIRLADIFYGFCSLSFAAIIVDDLSLALATLL